ncbi:ABC transporter substrate-binding protein [Mesorhizobium sp. Cs1299R1N1]|uniref:ABC transporter substrate-binding protein n=1 Tax=Mesorhizobium sp. Cs1299R1N1 TaxID=3015172 RepID=UPI00301B8098
MTKFCMSRRQVVGNAAALASLAALGIHPNSVLGAENDILKVRLDGDIKVLDPGYDNAIAEGNVLYMCMPRLAVSEKQADGTWSWKPSEYVESIRQDDATHISFTLRKGMMWSNDAGEITADDVKFSLERMLQSDWSASWPTLDHVDVKDKYNGTIVLKSPFVAAMLIGVASVAGTIIPKSLVEKMNDQKYSVPLPAQCGPYAMVEWTPRQKAVLKVNPNWWGAKPFFNEIHLVQVTDAKAAELALETGELDVTLVAPDTALRYTQASPPHVKLINQPGPKFTWMGMNTQNPKLADVRVRKAIQRAIDPDAILQGAYAGLCPRAYGVVPVGVLGHREKSNYSFNPEEAKSLLQEAGVSGLTLDIKTPADDAAQVAACQIIQSNLGDVGINVTVTPVDAGTFWDLGQESKGDAWKTLELYVIQYSTAPDPADATSSFRKKMIGAWNWERWSDPEYEELADKGMAESDSKKRAVIYVRMQEIMENSGAYFWITFRPVFYGYRDRIAPPAVDPNGWLRPQLFVKA